MPTTGDSIAERCEALGLRMTGQRRTVAQVLEESDDHPDVEELHRRAAARDAAISIATVYRTVKLFEEHGILERRDFRDGRARYEDADRDHHDHLIDVVSGDVIEFVDREIEALQRRVAERLGYELVGHRLELYGRRINAHRGEQPARTGGATGDET
ncbi:Fur family transcriptional regulator [Rubrimonas sp.]|uniref:Fur family transcriptional regulator n=1 Tax=Rubrimonas sp. TaxID=2036015 RepID=UPI002FDEA5C7